MILVAAEIALGFVIGSGVGAILMALGERLRVLLHLPVPRGLAPATAFALGSGAFGLSVLGAGALGGFRAAPLLVVTALAAVAGRWAALPRLARPLIGPVAMALPIWAVALAPPFFYDSWVYHLGLPWQALKDGALRAHPGNLFSTFPPLAQLIYAVPLSVGVTRAAGWIHLVGYAAACSAVTALARRLGASGPVSFLAGAAILYLPTAPLVPGFPAAEAWAVCAIVASVGLALAARPLRAACVAAGLVSGVACAARLQGAPWTLPVALILAVRIASVKRPGALRLAIGGLALFGLSVAVGAAPWWVKNAALLGDPLAPIGWHRAGIETLWRDASSHLQLASGPSDLLARVAGAMRARSLLVLPLLLVGLIVFWRVRRTATLLALGSGTFGLVAWSLTGALDRFLTPALALLIAAASGGGGRAGWRGLSAAIVLGLLGWGAWTTLVMESALGGVSLLGTAPAVYAATVVSDPSPAFRACEGLPVDAKLLLVAEPRGFLVPRAFETTSQHDRPMLADLLARVTSPDAAVKSLLDQGFTHVLVNVPEMRRLGGSYPVLPWSSSEGQRRFVELARSLGKPVVLEGEVAVYALRGDSPGSPRP